MANSFFEFFDANSSIPKRLKCFADANGILTFVTQIEAPSAPLPITWTGTRNFALVDLENNNNSLDIDGTGAALVRGNLSVGNVVSVGFPNPQRVLGNLAFSPSLFITPANNIAIVRNAPARLIAFKAENLGTVNRFLIFFNQTGNPTANQTTNIVDVFTIPPGRVIPFGSEYFSNEGIGFTSGIVAAMSTSRSQFVSIGSNEMILTVVSALN